MAEGAGVNVFRKLIDACKRAAMAVLSYAPGSAFDMRDLFWIGGLIAVGIGLAQIYVPSAWIVCGAVIFWMGVRR